MQHPELEKSPIKKLVTLAKPHRLVPLCLRNAATKVLKNYKLLDREGNPLESLTTDLENIAIGPRGETTPILNGSWYYDKLIICQRTKPGVN
jgi:hypothetical protein